MIQLQISTVKPWNGLTFLHLFAIICISLIFTCPTKILGGYETKCFRECFHRRCQRLQAKLVACFGYSQKKEESWHVSRKGTAVITRKQRSQYMSILQSCTMKLIFLLAQACQFNLPNKLCRPPSNCNHVLQMHCGHERRCPTDPAHHHTPPCGKKGCAHQHQICRHLSF